MYGNKRKDSLEPVYRASYYGDSFGEIPGIGSRPSIMSSAANNGKLIHTT